MQSALLVALWAALALAQQQPHHQQHFQVTPDTHNQQQQPPAQPQPPQRGTAGGKGSEDDAVPLFFSSSDSADPSRSSLSPADLYALSLSLLDTLTAHSLPASPAPYPAALQPTVSSTTFFLDSLESRLEGTTTGSVLHNVRRGVQYLYAGNDARRKAKGGRDLSVRGAVKALKGAVQAFAVDKPRAVAARRKATGGKGGEGWKERLHKAGLKGGVVLDEEETAEGMQEVLSLARQAGERGSAEAWLLLGALHLTGHLTLPANTSAALEAYTQASEVHGSPEAQYKLGFLYGSNFGGAVGGLEGQGQQGSALLHYTFAALAGHVPASMTVGYRHWAGIGTRQSCKEALPYYKAAAEATMRTFNSGPPGGRHLPPPKLRLSDLAGGAYGPGASSSRAALGTGGSTAQTQQEWDNLVNFHLFHADRGDFEYMFRLGRLYYQGFGAGGLGGVRNLARGRLQVGAAPSSLASSAGAGATGKVAGVADGLADGGRDFARASRWFLRLARKYWLAIDGREATWNPAWGPVGSKTTRGEAPKVGFYDAAKDRRSDKANEAEAMVAGLTAGYLGRMYLRGEGVGANYAKAFLWYSRGRVQGDRDSLNGLGIMYRDGLGVERDLTKATNFFQAASQNDHPDAQVNLGKLHFGMGDFVTATTYFEHAIRVDGYRQPDQLQAYFYLAELASLSSTPGGGGGDSCPIAVSFYKRVAERGDWDSEVWFEAERARERGDDRTALLGYWMMAERGYEQAQNNVAWLLDRDKTRLRLPILDPVLPSPSPATKQFDRLALAYWTRSAAQDNVDALLKTGDYYYAGIGTEDGLPQLEKAAGCYQSAATSRFSAMAMWNLGWMHETGKGVPQDFHLAKRYFDQAHDNSLDAYLPSTLSLVSLYSRALYHVLFGSPEDEQNALALFGKDPDPDTLTHGGHPSTYAVWSFGRAWRDIQRVWGIDPGPEPDVVPLHHEHEHEHGHGHAAAHDQQQQQQQQYFQAPEAPHPPQHEHRDVAAARRALQGGEDPVEWQQYQQQRAMGGRGRFDEEDDDEFYLDEEGDFGGTVAIVALSMLLAWLLYFRQRPEHRNALPRPAPPQPAAVPAPPAPAHQAPQPPHAPAATPAPQPPRPATPDQADALGDRGESEEEENRD
ncbi:hypothetical protein JCM10207_002243 [Rhodosporidiobolus poonsookiae]